MESSFLSILPNLSIGVIAILGLLFVVMKFLDTLEQRNIEYTKALKESEEALRRVEKEVRTNVLNQLAKNTEIMNDVSKTLERVTYHLDNPKI